MYWRGLDVDGMGSRMWWFGGACWGVLDGLCCVVLSCMRERGREGEGVERGGISCSKRGWFVEFLILFFSCLRGFEMREKSEWGFFFR